MTRWSVPMENDEIIVCSFDELEDPDSREFTIGEGDCVFLHTGHGNLWDPKKWDSFDKAEKTKRVAKFQSGEPGFGYSACEYLAERKIILLGADTWGVAPRFARTRAETAGLRNSYADPSRMGVDRWVAMVGAWAEVEAACLVIDIGTALTLDAIDDSGKHLGGQIIPGTAIMMNALAGATSDIPNVRALPVGKEASMQMFGRSTAAAVREGVQNAIAGAVDRAFQTLQSGGIEPTAVLTGGDASRILDALATTPLHRPNLVLQGLAHMLDSTE